MKFQHLRSSVRNKLPAALDVGQIAVNFNDKDPFLSIKDSAGTIRRLHGATLDATAPASPDDGQLWVDLSLDPPELKIWDDTNSVWEVATAIPAASETAQGIAELATQAEVDAGTDDTRIVTPLKLATRYVSKTSTTGAIALPAGTTAQRPTPGAVGQVRWNSDLSRYEGFDGTSWSALGGGAITDDTPPANPQDGDLWWSSLLGKLFVYYTDGDGSQWVEASPTKSPPASLWQRNGTILSPATAGDKAQSEPTAGADPANTLTTKGYVDTEIANATPASDWTRTGTTIAPTVAGDDVDLGTGDLSGAAATFTGDLSATGGTFAGGKTAIRASDGRISVGNYNAEQSTAIYNGNISIARNDGATALSIFNAFGSSSPSITLNADGTAGFARSDSGGRTVGIQGTNPVSGGALFIYNPVDGQAGDMVTIQAGTNAGDTVTHYMNFRRHDGTGIGYIAMNGAAAVNYSTSSDYRLKENVVPLANATDRLKKLQPRRFNFISEPGRMIDGFVAHEVQAVIPESVTGQKDGIDADGAPIYQGIDQSKLVPLLTASLQEALTRIEALEAEVQSLKGA